MGFKIELEKKEISIIINSLVYNNNRLNEDIKKQKKTKYKFGLNEKMTILKDVRKLINFFEDIK